MWIQDSEAYITSNKYKKQKVTNLNNSFWATDFKYLSTSSSTIR